MNPFLWLLAVLLGSLIGSAIPILVAKGLVELRERARNQ